MTTQVIQNEGTHKTYPVISITPVVLSGGMEEAVEVTGAFTLGDPLVTTITNPAITIGDKTLVYVGALITGQTLIINGETYQATKDGTNVLSAISGEWPVIEVGDNDVSLADTTSECGAAVEISFRKRWL